MRILPATTDPRLAAKVKDFCCDAVVREAILEHLYESGIDESVIEAEALRWVAHELKMLEPMMASLEMRIRNALREIAFYRKTFADQARIASNRIIEATPVIDLLRKPQTKKAD